MSNDFAKGGADVRAVQQLPGAPRAPSGVQGAAGVLGRLFGTDDVMVESKSVNLTDAAEEMAFGMASKVETLTLRQRVVKQGKRPEVPGQAEIEAVFHSMKDGDGARDLKQFSGQIIALLRGRQSPRRLLREKFSDPAKRYLATAYALNELKQSGAPAHEIESLTDFLAEIEVTEGGAIRAGLNTVEAAAEFSENAQQSDLFRKVYRDAVVGYESFPAALDKILTQFGDDHFEKGTRLLVKALSLDLQATRPSSEPVRLHAILQDLYSLQAVSTVLIRCRSIVFRTCMAAQTEGMTPIAIARDLLQLASDAYVTAYHFSDIARKYNVKDDEGQIVFFTGAMGAMRSMPNKVFRNDEARLKAIDAAQGALDGLLLDDDVSK